jgi:hypothetical protein
MSRYDLLIGRASPKIGPVKKEYHHIPQTCCVELTINSFEYRSIAGSVDKSYIEGKLYIELCRRTGWPIDRESVKFTERIDEDMSMIFSARVTGI